MGDAGVDSAATEAGTQCELDGGVASTADASGFHVGSGMFAVYGCGAMSPTCPVRWTWCNVTLPAGTLTAVYTTGAGHLDSGKVVISVDGQSQAMTQAALPGNTVNPAVNLGMIAAGTHTMSVQFTDLVQNVESWGGALDLYVQ